MKVLSLHNRYLIQGGEDRSFEIENDLLRELGIEVEEYVEDNQRIAELGVLRTAVRATWSQEAYRIVRDRLRSGAFDCVYIQNFFPLLSPAIYYAAKAEGVAVIQTLRNYRLLCANGLFFREGRPCEDCLGKSVPWPGVVHGCYRSNRAATAAVALMLTTHRLAGTWSRMVDAYVALTEFARAKFIEGGIPAEKLIVKPNFLASDPGEGAHQGEFALYVGRLSQEKGIRTMLEAWSSLEDAIPLWVVGDGPLQGDVASSADHSVRSFGRRSPAEVISMMKEARLLIFPSECYEGLPRVLIEAFAVGLPVVASNLGAMSSVVEDGRTGFHFRPGDSEDLARVVTSAWDHAERLRTIGAGARGEFEQRYTAAVNARLMVNILKRAAGLKSLPMQGDDSSRE